MLLSLQHLVVETDVGLFTEEIKTEERFVVESHYVDVWSIPDTFAV